MEVQPLHGTESALVEAARRGDVQAYEELVRRYQDVAFRVAFSILGSAEEAEDATQEGFVRAFHALERFRSGEPLRPWLVTIVANAARTHRAASARRPTLTLDAVATHPTDESVQSPEGVALVQEQRRELLAAVNALRDDDQQVIAYRYFLDLSETEMAAVLGCARGTVKSRLSRALTRLRQQLSIVPAGPGGGNDG